MGDDTVVKHPEQLRRGALVAVCLSLMGLVVLYRLTGGKDAWRELAQLNPAMLVVSLSLVLLNWVLDSCRIMILTRSLGGELSVWDGVRISLMGAFVSNVTPFDSGGEPVQAYLLTSKGLTAGQSSAIIAVKTVLNASARVCLGLIGAAYLLFWPVPWSLPNGWDIALTVGMALYFAVYAFSIFLLARPETLNAIVVPAVKNKFTLKFFKPETLDMVLERVDDGLREFRDAVSEFACNKRIAIWSVAGLSFLVWMITLAIPGVILRGLGMNPPLFQVMVITIVFYLASAYAPTPGSSGAAELGFAALYNTLVPRQLLGLFVTIWRLLTYYLSLGMGGAMMTARIARRSSGSSGKPIKQLPPAKDEVKAPLDAGSNANKIDTKLDAKLDAGIDARIDVGAPSGSVGEEALIR